MSVKNQHADYVRMLPKWKRCRDASEGQDAVHASGEAYLPKLKDQTQKDYEAYVKRTPFYGATWRTISGLNGMLFRKPPNIDLPESVRTLIEDVTMSGVPLQSFAQDIGEQALTVGRVGVLVDYPIAPVGGVTMADAQLLNLRPIMSSYRAESIINWRMRYIGNRSVLSMVVIEEREEIQKDEFTFGYEVRYRVLDLDPAGNYRVRIFTVDKDGKDVQVGEDVYPTMNGKPLIYIPFIFLGTDDITPDVDDPPLIDLVDMNLSHYRTTADYEHGCHFAGLPTAVISGYSPVAGNDGTVEKLYVGSASAWVFSDPAAKASYLEFTGQGLSALESNLDRKEQQMAVLGARMLEAMKKGIESAQTASIHRVGEESMLASVALSISLGMTRSLGWFSDWAGGSGKASIELNRDFYPVPMDPQELTALIAGWQAGAFSDQVLFENLQQGEIIGQDVTLEEEQARISSQPPKMAAAPKLPGQKQQAAQEPAAAGA